MCNKNKDIEPFFLPQIFFVKSEVPDTRAISIPDELIPPCDLDEVELSAADCAAIAGLQDVTYYECDSILADYRDTVDLVS